MLLDKPEAGDGTDECTDATDVGTVDDRSMYAAMAVLDGTFILVVLVALELIVWLWLGIFFEC